MELQSKVSSFRTDYEELKNIYILYVRSILEQSATVWHSSLTEENKNDLEGVQKTALKVILGVKYKSYENALRILDIETLNDRRIDLCLNFARKSSKHPKMNHMFPLADKPHQGGQKNTKFNMPILIG